MSEPSPLLVMMRDAALTAVCLDWFTPLGKPVSRSFSGINCEVNYPSLSALRTREQTPSDCQSCRVSGQSFRGEKS